MKVTKAAKTVPMACLSIDHRDYLMPADKAMKVAELMQSAFACNRQYGDSDYTYTPGEQPRVEFAFVKAHQVRQPPSPAGQKLRLGGAL